MQNYTKSFSLIALRLELIAIQNGNEKKNFARMLGLSEVQIDDGTITILPNAQNETHIWMD